MKLEAIFSWKRMKGYKDLENQFFWNFAKLAVLTAKQFHTTVLYTDKEGEKDFKNRGISFDKVTVLPEIENITGNVYCMPKLYAMMAQTSPYVHLDFDTWTNFPYSSTEMIGWGYPEVNLSKERDYKSINHMYYEYYDKFNKHISEYFDPSFYQRWDWGVVPNFSAFIVNNPALVKSIYKKILYKLKDLDIDNSSKGEYAMIIEQLLFMKYIEYYKIPYTFIYDTSPFSFQTNNEVVIANKRTRVSYERGIYSDIQKLKFLHFNDYRNFPVFSNTIIKKLLNKFNMI